MSGVDLNLKEFTDIRFGLDRRLEEVARMLCSSTIPTVKGLDREITYVSSTQMVFSDLTVYTETSTIKPKNTKTTSFVLLNEHLHFLTGAQCSRLVLCPSSTAKLSASQKSNIHSGYSLLISFLLQNPAKYLPNQWLGVNFTTALLLH